MPDALPIGLSDEFAQDRTKQVQWKAFLTKNRLEALELGKVVAMVREFWLEVRGQVIAESCSDRWQRSCGSTRYGWAISS